MPVEAPLVHPNDPIYDAADPEPYFQAGHTAVRFIEVATMAADTGLRPMRILDLPCGYGRVTRALRQAYPNAEITVCDIAREEVDFCAEAFEARPVYSVEDPREIELAGSYDLIFCGSLLTHVAADRWEHFLDLFESLLADRGMLVFTTCGRWIAFKLRERQMLGLPPERVAGLLADYESEGFGYRDYPPEGRDKIEWETTGYGLSVSSPSWVCARIADRPGLRLVSFLEMGFNHNQDAVAVVREPLLGKGPTFAAAR